MNHSCPQRLLQNGLCVLGEQATSKQAGRSEEPRMCESTRSRALGFPTPPRARKQASPPSSPVTTPRIPTDMQHVGKPTQLGAPKFSTTGHPPVHYPGRPPPTRVGPVVELPGTELCQRPECDEQQTLPRSLQGRVSWWHRDLSRVGHPGAGPSGLRKEEAPWVRP